MTLINLVFWLRLAILIGYLLGQKGRKSVCNFLLWPISRHLTSDLTLKNQVFWLRLAILVGYLLEQEHRKSIGSFFLWPVPRHLTSNLTFKDDLDKSGFLAAASHFSRLYFGTKRSQIGW